MFPLLHTVSPSNVANLVLSNTRLMVYLGQETILNKKEVVKWSDYKMTLTCAVYIVFSNEIYASTLLNTVICTCYALSKMGAQSMRISITAFILIKVM